MPVVESAVGRALVAHARAHEMTLQSLARALELSSDDVDELLYGDRLVDSALAERLSVVLGKDREHWLTVDDRRARVARWLTALDQFGPASLRALRDRGHVSATKRQPGQLADELDAFFGCEPEDRDNVVPASFRQSDAHPVHEDAVQVWLRLASMQGDRVAELDDVPALDLDDLGTTLPTLARVADEAPSDYLPRVRDRLADAGVVMVFQPDVPGTRLSGASWPTPGGFAVVALTLRHAFDDFFWWTVYHECAHLLHEHGLVVDGSSDDGADRVQEEQANELARAALLPAGWDRGLEVPSKARVVRAAHRLGLPPGVLVGQLQNRHRVAPKDMNGLKRSMPDPASLEVLMSLDQGSGPAWDQAAVDLQRRADAS